MNMLNWADWIILAIVLASCVISLNRGFVREAVSLATWVAAFVIGRLFYEVLAGILSDYFDATPSVHQLVAFLVLFIATLIVGNLLGSLFASLIKLSGLSATDRILGIGFGLLRGGLVVVIILVLLKMTPVIEDPWWRESQLIPHFLVMETWSRDMARDIGQMIWQIGD